MTLAQGAGSKGKLVLPCFHNFRFTECCASHKICMAAATTCPPSLLEDSVCCACHEICTPGSPSAVFATKSASAVFAPKSALQVHKVLCLPRNLHSRFTKCCACHEICTPGSQSAAPATKSARQAAAAQRRPRVHAMLHWTKPALDEDPWSYQFGRNSGEQMGKQCLRF